MATATGGTETFQSKNSDGAMGKVIVSTNTIATATSTGLIDSEASPMEVFASADVGAAFNTLDRGLRSNMSENFTKNVTNNYLFIRASDEVAFVSEKSPTMELRMKIVVTPPPGYSLSQHFNFTGDVQTFSTVGFKSLYIEACGAKGADNCNNPYGTSVGGDGGCIYSVITGLPSLLYVYIGGMGVCQTPGFNGGGSGHCANEDVGQFGGGGGGATDIRTSSSLSDRIVVAGGGGGA